jgi:signal-transduction protein with cAMP-binding, CBS, and nucleotidyltransferase domain
MSHPSVRSLQRFVSQFKPLNQIPNKYHSQLISNLRLITIVAGEKFIRKSKLSTVSHFLLKGRVEIRESFDNRFPISHHDQERVPLEDQVGTNGTIKALTPCVLMVVNNDIINQYLLWNEDYKVCHLDEGDMSLDDDDMIDDDFQEDWENVFFQSPLAANLCNAAIHRLMSQLSDMPVKANQKIFEARSTGDYFYLLKQGRAQVHTERHGPFGGKIFDLNPGDYFGDEALVAGTPRNASVVMSTEGVLGRLDINAFDSIVKEQLVPPFVPPKNANDSEIKIIDVRFAAEYKQGHEAGSTNLPISHLRKKLTSLENSYLYVLAPANDKRSELATYLMRQAGFNAFQMVSEA